MCPRPLGRFPLPLRLSFFALLVEIRLLSRPTHAVNHFPDTFGQAQVLNILNQVLNPLHHAAGCVEYTSNTASSKE